ncbi:MAG: aldehyde dehydrogenase [Bacteroidales bacterium]|nr:aldehyde dehydrogenase [Bacteroidales bacterium]
MNTPTGQIIETLQQQREFFASGQTLEIRFRKEMLRRLLNAMELWEEQLAKALWKDLHKSYEEAYLTELSIIKGEIKSHLKNLSNWAKPEKVPTPAKLAPSKSRIVKEPLGCALIIAPWNYPVQLLLAPLVGAISAGCTAMLKPSPYTPATSKVLEEMILQTFPSKFVSLVQGDRTVNTALLEQRWDMIFFTGSPALGRTVMSAAARNLTPVVLELGGKSPCIIDKTANIEIASRRIAWGKTLNSGQTCIAPDCLIIHKDVKEAFIDAFGKRIRELHGDDILESPHYVHMVNEKAFQRVCSYIQEGKIAYGGRSNHTTLCIEPTLLEDIPPSSPVMEEEIFGPVFPMIVLDDSNGTPFNHKVTAYLQAKEKPLALYWFGEEKDGWEVIRNTSSGGACINDVIMHIANERLPFGGVGNSGMGSYHNRRSFECFSHSRSVLVTPAWIDLPFRYMPYKLFSLIKKII